MFDTYSDKEEKQRTLLQNRSLHLYLTQLAEELNAAGLEISVVLKRRPSVPWSLETIKNLLWRPLQEAQLGKKSTTTLTTKECDLIYNTLNRFTSEMGIFVPWPSVEKILAQQRNEEYDLSHPIAKKSHDRV